MSPRLAVALDVPDAEQARALARRLEGHADILKIGLQLFIAEGPSLVREFVDRGWAIFLDLKIHDIPATAERAVRSVRRLGVELLTVHASGGDAMLRAAVAGRDVEGFPKLLGVTVLTSLTAADLTADGSRLDPGQLALSRARLVAAAGVDGVVASVHEAGAVKAACGCEFLVVTPGIRLPDGARHDQARVATPAEAAAAGSDVLVVGRPITGSEDPAAAARAIRQQIESDKGERRVD